MDIICTIPKTQDEGQRERGESKARKKPPPLSPSRYANGKRGKLKEFPNRFPHATLTPTPPSGFFIFLNRKNGIGEKRDEYSAKRGT